MKINFGNLVFHPKLLTSILTVIFFILFLHLGFWQLDRAEQKRQIYSFFNERQSKEVINLNNSFERLSHANYSFIRRHGTSLDDLLWRKVIVTGSFLEDRQVLLDNQVNNGQAGYFVYTPFKVKSIDDIFLVNRGWVPVGEDRRKSPNLIYTSGEVTIHGVLKETPRTGLLLSEDQVEKLEDNITRLQKIDINEVSKLTKIKLFENNYFIQSLFPYVIRLSPESDHGYIRNWKLLNSGENVHIGYAFQWFAFAVTLLVIYFVMNIKKKIKKNG